MRINFYGTVFDYTARREFHQPFWDALAQLRRRVAAALHILVPPSTGAAGSARSASAAKGPANDSRRPVETWNDATGGCSVRPRDPQRCSAPVAL